MLETFLVVTAREGEVLLSCGSWRAGVPLKSFRTKSYSVQNVNNTEVEEPWSTGGRNLKEDLCLSRIRMQELCSD